MSGLAPPKSVVFGCVAEPTSHFYDQVLRLVRSIRWFGGLLAGADVFVCFVGEPDTVRRTELEGLGVQVRTVQPFNPLNRYSNKVRFLELPELVQYEIAVLLDCDMVLVQDPSQYLVQPTLQLMIADMPTVPSERLVWLCGHFGLVAPAPIYRTTCSQEPTVWYCNTGVLIMPTAWIARILPPWRDFILRLCAEPSLLDPPYNHCNQAAMALTYIAAPLPFAELPVAMNFPLHQTGQRPSAAMVHEDPVILHYHDRLDADGLLLPVPYPLAQARIEQINARLRGNEPLRQISVCITGMHHSGISLVAQILQRCELYLGREHQLAASAADNLDGYCEDQDFHQLNEAILSHFDGGWDATPSLAPNWVDLPELEPLRQRARSLIGEFDNRRCWGWKDPCSSLTMPFWRRLIPGLKVVICVRDPLEVAQSLSRHGMSSVVFGLRLWQTYYERLLSSVAPEDRIITHYGTYFADAAVEVERVLAWLGIPAPADGIEYAGRVVSDALRHDDSAVAELHKRAVPTAVLELYGRLCDEARARGGVAPAAPVVVPSVEGDDARQATLAALRREDVTSQTELAILQRVLEAREAEVAFLQPTLAAREVEIANFARELAMVREILVAREAEVAFLQPTLAAREVEIANFARELAMVREILAAREAEITNFARELVMVREILATRGVESADFTAAFGIGSDERGNMAGLQWHELAGWFQWRSAQEEAAERFPTGSCFVEVGSFLGRSLCSLGQVVQRSGKAFAVVGIDTCRGSGPEGQGQKDYHSAVVARNGGTFAGELHKNIIACGYGDTIALIVSDSLSASRLFGDASIDWVHLDARHDYASVKADIEAWLPKIKPGGWLSGDDYDEAKWPEVVRAVGDVLPGATVWSTRQWRWIVA